MTIACLTALVIASSLIVGLATWGLTAALPDDTGETADAIVILGRGKELRDNRLTAAYQLWKDQRAPRLFVSGTMDVLPIVDRLKLRGIPGEIMGGEGCSESTEENAVFTAAVLAPQGVKKIILLTDAPHMLRSLLIFRSVGFTVISHPVALPAEWKPLKKLELIFREYAALIYYGFSGRLQNQAAVKLGQPEAAVLQRMQEWDCVLDRR